jgi:hypothetical protein
MKACLDQQYKGAIDEAHRVKTCYLVLKLINALVEMQDDLTLRVEIRHGTSSKSHH